MTGDGLRTIVEVSTTPAIDNPVRLTGKTIGSSPIALEKKEREKKK